MTAIVVFMALLGTLIFSRADTVPPQLTGTWGTAASLYAGTTGQSQMFLDADGLGMLVGSTGPAHRLDGVDDGKPGPRALVGFLLHVTVDGNTLTARPFTMNPRDADMMARANITLTCRHDPAAATLACTGPNGTTAIHRQSATVPADVAPMLRQARDKLRTSGTGT